MTELSLAFNERIIQTRLIERQREGPEGRYGARLDGRGGWDEKGEKR